MYMYFSKHNIFSKIKDSNVWESRDVVAILECKECSMQLACGGGSGSVARNKSGTVCSTDCRPIKELLELGFGAYFNEN